MTTLFNKLQKQYDQKLPFVIYNKPNKPSLTGLFQHSNKLYYVNDFHEKGFVFAPFNEDKIVLIPEKYSEILIEDFEFNSENNYSHSAFSQNAQSKTHQDLVEKGIDAINRGLFSKVVLSRKEIIDYPNLDLVALFKKILNTYPTAFTYCWFHPKVGLWLGAFSERLLKTENNLLQTMALAGTQPFKDSEKVIWQQKEKEEQQFVTDFILENLKDKISEIQVSAPYTIRAGNVIHIKTDIQGVLKENSNLKELISVLHPTPAVCGFPKLEAKKFILENENYDREYYSGFLGELNIDNKTDLFVNLRCMQIKDDQVHLYIGGGITKDSDPAKEWLETVNKSTTMKKILF